MCPPSDRADEFALEASARAPATKVAGWDIGGAHLKCTLVDAGRIVDAFQIETPLWQGLRSLEAAFDIALARIGSSRAPRDYDDRRTQRPFRGSAARGARTRGTCGRTIVAASGLCGPLWAPCRNRCDRGGRRRGVGELACNRDDRRTQSRGCAPRRHRQHHRRSRSRCFAPRLREGLHRCGTAAQPANFSTAAPPARP